MSPRPSPDAATSRPPPPGPPAPNLGVLNYARPGRGQVLRRLRVVRKHLSEIAVFVAMAALTGFGAANFTYAAVFPETADGEGWLGRVALLFMSAVYAAMTALIVRALWKGWLGTVDPGPPDPRVSPPWRSSYNGPTG